MPKYRFFQKVIPFKDADPNVQELITASAEARQMAYCPYSNFQVGAAVRILDGTIYKGCNVENAAHTPTCCAERTALVKAVSEGHREFISVAVCAYAGDNTFVSPCGVCRQVISEFGSNISIYLVRPDLAEILVTSIEELLPLAFHL